MRTIGFATALALVTAISVPASAKDWSQMNVGERLAWTTEYARQVCPYGLTLAKADGSRQNEIGSAPQFGVKAYILLHCKSGPVASASR